MRLAVDPDLLKPLCPHLQNGNGRRTCLPWRSRAFHEIKHQVNTWVKVGWSLSIPPRVVGPDLMSPTLAQKGETGWKRVPSSGSRLGDNSETCWKNESRGATQVPPNPWANSGETQDPELPAGNKQSDHLQGAGPEPASPVSSQPLLP